MPPSLLTPGVFLPNTADIVTICGMPAAIDDVETSFAASSGVPRFVVSAAAEDALGGGGLVKLRIEGLGDGYVAQTEDVDLNGTNEVETARDWLRINRLLSLQLDGEAQGFGPALPTGNIYVLASSGGTSMYTLYAGEQVSRLPMYTVPAGRTLIVTHIAVSWKGIPGSLLAWRRAPGDDWQPMWRHTPELVVAWDADANEPYWEDSLRLMTPIAIAEKTDIMFGDVGGQPRILWRGHLVSA